MLSLKNRRTQLAFTQVRFAILTAFDLRMKANGTYHESLVKAIQALEESHLGLAAENFLEKYEPAYQWVYGKWKNNIGRICLNGFSLVLDSNLGLAIQCKVSLGLFPREVGILEIFFELNKDCLLKRSKQEDTNWTFCTDELIYLRHILLEEEPIDEKLFRVEGFFKNQQVKRNNFSAYISQYINEICEILGNPIIQKYPMDTITSIQLLSFANTASLVKNHQIIEDVLNEKRNELVGIVQTDEDWRSLKVDYLDRYFASSSCYHRKKYLIALAEYSDTLVISTSYKDPLRLHEIGLWKNIYAKQPRVARLYEVETEEYSGAFDKDVGKPLGLANMKNQHVLYDEFSLYIRYLLLRIRFILDSEDIITSLEPRAIARMQKQTLNVANEIESLELLRREMLRATSLNKMLEATFNGREIKMIEQTMDRKLEILGSALDRETLFLSERSSRALALLGIILAANFGLDLARVTGYFLFLGEYNTAQPKFIWQYGVLNVVFFFTTLLLLILFFILVGRTNRQSKG